MTASNKEILDKLTDYLLTQDHKVVCRVLANHMLDQLRLHNLEILPADEADRLFKRIELNANSLRDFALNGPKGNLTCGPLPDDET
jgi:hypothetical protein